MASAAGQEPATTATISEIEQIVEQHRKSSSGIVVARGQRIEFSCQKGYHYGKYSSGSGKKRKRKQIGKLEVVYDKGHHNRIREYLSNHKCHYPNKEYLSACRQYGRGHELAGIDTRGHTWVQQT